MGIRVECPHGHVFKVKDKYSGKRGLCPHCKGQVEVRVPKVSETLSKEASDIYRKAVIDEKQGQEGCGAAASSSSVLDDHPDKLDSSTSGSLLGSSVIRHNVKCACGTSVPMWYARCPSCGKYMEH